MATRKLLTVDEVNELNQRIADEWDPAFDEVIEKSTKRAKISMSRMGQAISEETKQKLSKAHKGKARSKEATKKLTQAILDRTAMAVSIEGKVYSSISEAARQMGVSNAYIRRRVLHKEKWQNCFFVSERKPAEASFIKDNSNIKSFLLIDPNGKRHTGVNVREFCLAHNLCPYSIRRICRGEGKSYKGWTGQYID